MLVGRWEALPLRTLERALLDNKIADPDTLKVGLIIFKAFGFKELSTLYDLRCLFVRCESWLAERLTLLGALI